MSEPAPDTPQVPGVPHAPDALPDRAALHEQAGALRRTADELDAAVGRVAGLAGDLAASWADHTGAAWAHRLDLIGRELARQAGTAAELARSLTEQAEHTAVGPRPGDDPAGGTDGTPSWTLPGVRLGGTDGTRAGERRGVVVPTLRDGEGG